MMNKTIGIVIGIIVLGALGLSGYFLYSFKSQVVFQETYTSARHGFSVGIPEGWKYTTNPEIAPEESDNYAFVIELTSPDENILLPIFIERKSWDSVVSEVHKNFPAELIYETEFAGQKAIKITPPKTFAFAYHFRIRHPNQQAVLEGSVLSTEESDDARAFHKTVEAILNSIVFQ